MQQFDKYSLNVDFFMVNFVNNKLNFYFMEKENQKHGGRHSC